MDTPAVNSQAIPYSKSENGRGTIFPIYEIDHRTGRIPVYNSGEPEIQITCSQI